ncbi:nuclear transport factor 2 family protein [Kitasatospora sp. NPDC085895]|uniref:nuclear transport factor 2 family protein n=1 Tax=Kitasatospora sp. NPDC085895 TaxID=3155057 RepID=UPI00344B79B8
MDQSLITRMREYLDAGLAMDVETLDELYDPSFENIRTDEAGQVVTITKEQFMLHFRAMRDQGKQVGESVDDVRFLATVVRGDQGTVIMHREQQGVPVRYCFVWQRAGGRWTTLLHELSFERDITLLIAAVEAARAGTA